MIGVLAAPLDPGNDEARRWAEEELSDSEYQPPEPSWFDRFGERLWEWIADNVFGWFGGFAGAGWHVHVMHLTGLIMSALFLVVFFGPWRSMRRALDGGDASGAAAAADKVRRLVTVNLALGLFTVAVAAWGRFGG